MDQFSGGRVSAFHLVEEMGCLSKEPVDPFLIRMEPAGSVHIAERVVSGVAVDR